MKNRIILIAASIAAMVVSCQKEVVPTSNVKTEPMVLTPGVETKTILDGNSVLWTPGDAIMVIDNKGGKNEFAIDNTITGNVEKAIFSGEVADQTSKFLAVYPSTCVDVESSSYASTIVTIPIAQTPKAGSFETNHNVTVAHGSKTPGTPEVTGVQFKNVGGLLKFTLPESLKNIKKVSLSSTTAIAGQMKVTPNNDGFTTEFVGTATEVIMTPGENGYFTCVGDANTFWFAVAPVSLTDLTISVIDGNGNSYSMTQTWTAASPLKIEAGKYKNLGTIDMKLAGITTAHTYASNTLTGTKVTVTVPDNTKSLTLTIKRGSDVIWENVTTSSETAVKTFEVSGAEKYTSYPYLPKGTYTLSGKYTIEGKGTEVVLGEKSFTITEDPNFTVTPATPMTSYSYYANDDVTTANSKDPLKIENINSGTINNLSDNIKNNSKYSIDKTVTVNNGATIADGIATATQLGQHTVTTTYTFDGVSVSADATCHITGLPYSLAESGWVGNSEKSSILQRDIYGLFYWNNGTLILGNNNSWDAIKDKLTDITNFFGSFTDYTTITKTFHIPDDISVETSVAGSVVAAVESYNKQTGTIMGFIPKYETYYRHDTNKCTITVGNGETFTEAKSDYDSKDKPAAYTQSFNSTNNKFKSTLTTSKATAIIYNSNSEGDNMTNISSLNILYSK